MIPHTSPAIPSTFNSEAPLRFRRLYAVADFMQAAIALSMRGLLVLLVLIYLFLNPILNQSDIVASVLAGALAGFIVLLTAVCAIAGFRIKRKLAPELIFPAHSEGIAAEGIFSKAVNKVLLRAGPITIPPLFTLSVELIFEQPGASSSCHLLSGQIDPSHPITYRITFPHRGLWRVSGIRCVLEDRFGFSCVIWSDIPPADLIVPVHPQRIENPRLPLISSTFRAGDDISHHTHRLGEPFDIKPYQPSDGIKKILWKVFAKRGELVARHAEQAVTPEGHVIGFILATRDDDHLASWALAYFRELEELNLTMEAGCLGMAQKPLAQDTRTLDDLLVASAFAAPVEITRSLAKDIISRLSQRSSAGNTGPGEQIALFISESAMVSDRKAQEILALIRILESEQISPVVCLQRAALTRSSPARRSRVRDLFLTPPQTQSSATPVSSRNLFLKSCSAAHIKVLQEPYASEGARAQ